MEHEAAFTLVWSLETEVCGEGTLGGKRKPTQSSSIPPTPLSTPLLALPRLPSPISCTVEQAEGVVPKTAFRVPSFQAARTAASVPAVGELLVYYRARFLVPGADTRQALNLRSHLQSALLASLPSRHPHPQPAAALTAPGFV